jgi:hypothetical protein
VIEKMTPIRSVHPFEVIEEHIGIRLPEAGKEARRKVF